MPNLLTDTPQPPYLTLHGPCVAPDQPGFAQDWTRWALALYGAQGAPGGCWTRYVIGETRWSVAVVVGWN